MITPHKSITVTNLCYFVFLIQNTFYASLLSFCFTYSLVSITYSIVYLNIILIRTLTLSAS